MSSHLNSVADRLLSVFCRFVLKYFINRWDNLALWLIEGGGITKQVTIFHYESREKTEKIDRFISASIYKIHAKCRLVRGVFFCHSRNFFRRYFLQYFLFTFPRKIYNAFFCYLLLKYLQWNDTNFERSHSTLHSSRAGVFRKYQ